MAGKNKKGQNQRKQNNNKVNYHYLNLNRKRQKAIQLKKEEIEKEVQEKTCEEYEDIKNNKKTKMPKTIYTELQQSHPSEVTSDSSLQLEELKEKLKKKEEELEELKKIKKVKRVRKKKLFTQIDWQVRNIAKQQIFRKVKFISSTQQLDNYVEKNSIGNYFLKCYMEHVENKAIIGDKGIFWSSVKQTVYEAINEKRNAVQTALKKIDR